MIVSAGAPATDNTRNDCTFSARKQNTSQTIFKSGHGNGALGSHASVSLGRSALISRNSKGASKASAIRENGKPLYRWS